MMRVHSQHQTALGTIAYARTLITLLTMSRSVAALSPKKLCPDAQVRRSIVSLAHRLDGLDKPTVWHEFSPLAVQHDAVNLGQGFPDWEPPQFVLESMQLSITNKNNQYARSAAHLPLAQVLAEDYFCKWKIRMDPATQIATAVGCTNALYCALQGLINPGDEVILLEPAFDIYAVCICV
jgi:aspartate/methionine/tyrosine aminotransferase